jgi:hypothetical protein
VVVVVVVVALGVALLKSGLFSQPETGQAPVAASTAAASPQPTDAPLQASAYVATFGDSLYGISMTSASDGWAVGSDRGIPLILRYTGHRWERITNAIGGGFQAKDVTLTQVAMLSATNGWAVGSYHDAANTLFGLILRYNGSRWMPQMSLPRVNLNGLAMLSASDGWAVGGDDHQQGVLLHYTGATWQVIPLATMTLNQVVMTAPTDGWIVGQSEDSGFGAWHYDGKTWTQVRIPGVDISHIAMTSANDGWAVGFKRPAGAGNALIADGSYGGDTVFAHYDGKTWTAMQTFTTPMNVKSLALDAPDDGWAFGSVAKAVIDSTTLYLHYTGGQWKQVTGPELNGYDLAVLLLSASDGWAVSDDGAILRYQHNAWKMVVSPGTK